MAKSKAAPAVPTAPVAPVAPAFAPPPMAPAAAAPAAPEAPAKVAQNGVTRPKQGTKTGYVWDVADAESAKLNAPVPRKNVMDICVAAGINAATVATQYGRWRKFHGLKGAVAAPAVAAPTAPATA